MKYSLPATIVFVLLIAVAAHFGWLGGASGDGCEVVKIYDGDTMTLRCPDSSEDVKVRMYCIDTPEMRQKPWGTVARDHLRQRSDQWVQLVAVDRDRYGRVVGEVYNQDGENLNLMQVRDGQAAVYQQYCDKPEYQRAEQQAREEKLGIWAKRGLQQRPWDWRKQQR